MIKITSRNSNFTVLAECEMLEPEIEKRDRVITTSISGHNKESYVRALRTLKSINVTYMTSKYYEELENIFMFDNFFDIEDTTTGKTYSKLYIDMDSMKLSPKLDRVENKMFYSGTLTLNSR